ncbi:MAG: SDR family oxidoreductase [Candidatus Eisenbacteria bacterium]
MDLDLRERVVFITGASGGLGQALADSFAAEGARLALQAHRHLRELRVFTEAHLQPDRTFVVGADVSDPAQVHAAFSQTIERFGRIDICIVNAGIWWEDSLRLDEMTTDRVRHTIAVDLLGAIWTARSFMRSLAADPPAESRRGASMTFIGSTAGRFGESGHADYSASKAALRGLVRSLKNEIVSLDPYARVNMVEPGWVLTPMTHTALQAPETVQRIIRTMPIQQIARPIDIARAVLFLSSPRAARHISGEILTVAGGMEGRIQWEAGEIDVAAIQRRMESD